jgi:hypothetical protein
LHVHVGTDDAYFLNDGVTYFEQRTGALTSPRPDFQFIYGVSQPHGWAPVTDRQLRRRTGHDVRSLKTRTALPSEHIGSSPVTRRRRPGL